MHAEGQVRYEPDGDRPRVVLAGAIDAACERAFDAAYADVTAAGPGDLTVDLSEVTFLGTHGLAFFIRLRNHLAPNGHRVILFKPSSDVMLTVHAAGLRKIFTVVEPEPPGAADPR
jgi:anti-anti-sigma factor